MQQLLKNANLEYAAIAVAAANNTDDDSSEFDMSGYESIVFFCTLTDSAATGVATLNVQGSDTSGSGHATITGATHTATCVVNDDLNAQFLAVEVTKPLERYIQANRTSATANIAFGECYAIRLKARKAQTATPGTALSAPTVVVGS